MSHQPYEPTIGGLQVPPPYEFTGLTVFGFPLVADLQPLQDLCDAFLSMAPASTGITFEPIPAGGSSLLTPNVGIVTMQAIEYTSLHATTPPWDDFDGASQREIYFGIPVVRKQGGVVVDIGVFLAYIFVDNFVSVVTAREVLGFPKLLAKLKVDGTFPSSPITARFLGRTVSTDPIALRQIIRVTSLSGFSTPAVPVPIGMFFGQADLLFSFSPYFTQITAATTAGIYFGYSARTIVDPENPTTDSHQSLLRCTYVTTNVATGLLAPVEVKLTPLMELDLEKTLGIRRVGGKIVPLNPFFVHCDLALDGVRTLWKSC
jgi:hypothetical protein